jgi:hypothetical protein
MSSGPDNGQGSRGDGGLGVIPTGSYMAGDGGGTYTKSDRNPSIQEYESVFGPSARDIKEDPMRSKRHQRWHLPDVLKGPNPYLTDRIDGLITDTTNSPFTSTILPYTYLEHPDAKIKWNVWSFDEGMANRVPYESAARVLTQSKQSFAGYTVRQGLAITMEHNFMMSPEGRVNFSNQLKQMVGSIQYTNDLDVHIALITAPSYARKINEKYYSRDKNVWQRCRQYVDLFGIMQKTPNALDLIIEDTKATLKSWGSQDPSFLLTNSKLTMQLTMSPERTQYVTQGPDGLKRLAEGPNLTKYRGLDVIHSRSFSTETGARPRDLLDRRVRVAEYYTIPGVDLDSIQTLKVQMYDQSKDTMFTIDGSTLLEKALLPQDEVDGYDTRPGTTTRGEGGHGHVNMKEILKNMAMKHSTGHIEGNHRSFSGMTASMTASTWKDVAQLAHGNNSSIYDFIKKYDVSTPDRSGKYATTNGITFPENSWDLTRSDKNKTMFAERIANWTRPESIAPPGSTSIKPNIYFGECPTQEIIDFLMEDVALTSAEQANISRVYQMMGYAMGMDNMNTDQIAGFKYRNSRLFMINAAMVAEGTDDDHYLNTIKMMPGDTTLAGWLSERRSSGSFPEEVSQTFKRKPGAPTIFTNMITATDKMDKYWKGETPDYTATFQMNLLHLVRHLLSGLFGARTNAGGVNALTLKESKGVFMGFKFPPEMFGASSYDGDDSMSSEGSSGGVGQENILAGWDKDRTKKFDIVMIRPNIEHNMLGVVMGRGGKDDLGATFWGQTELSVYDDGMHGKWGMSYKYHERAIVLNEKNLMRCWDVAFNGYNGGCDDTFMTWGQDTSKDFRDSSNNLDRPYDGDSIVCMIFPAAKSTWPNPILMSACTEPDDGDAAWIDPENINAIYDKRMNVFDQAEYRDRFKAYEQAGNFPDFRMLHATRKTAGQASNSSVTAATSLAFQGTIKIDRTGQGIWEHTRGAGHLGDSYVGCASVREGKGYRQDGAPSAMRMM